MKSVVWLLPLISFAKFQSGSITLGGDKSDLKWRYISKFGYEVGTGTWAVRFKTIRPFVAQPTTIRADVFLDKDWSMVEALESACDKEKYRRASGEVTLPPAGEWSEWVNGTLSQSSRPYVWYFAANDCKGSLLSPTRIKFELVARQEDGDEFSVEMQGTRLILFVEVLFFVLLGLRVYQRCVQFVKSADSLHPVIWTLVAMILLHFVAALFQFIHLWVYANDGSGVKALDVIAEILNVVSQVIGSSILILIGLGYTLLHSRLGNLDVVIPVVFIIAVVHVLLVGFGKIKDDASYKFYENEGVVGWILLSLRVLLLLWFLWSVKETAKESGPKLKFFLRKFGIAGIVYFMSFPVVFIMTGLFAPYVRNKVMILGMFLMRFGSYLWLVQLFLTRGDYFEVSTLKSSFLPGGVRPGLDKEE